MNSNFTQIASTASTIAGLLPTIIGLVQGVEAAMPASTPGAQKLLLVQTGLQAACTASGAVQSEFEAMWPHIQNVISSVVSVFNTIGLFHKRAAADQAS